MTEGSTPDTADLICSTSFNHSICKVHMQAPAEALLAICYSNMRTSHPVVQHPAAGLWRRGSVPRASQQFVPSEGCMFASEAEFRVYRFRASGLGRGFGGAEP